MSVPVAANLSPQPAAILIVEDEILIRCVAADVLRDRGHAVLEASSGDEALRLLAAGVTLDLLITDVQMPGLLDGVDLAKAARALRPDLVIAVASASFDPAAVPPGTVAASLVKPYSTTHLLTFVDRLLAR